MRYLAVLIFPLLLVSCTPVKPSAPLNVIAKQSGHGVATVTWEKPAKSGSESTLTFSIHALPQGSVEPSPISATGDETTKVFEGLLSGVPYQFYVVASSSAGDSPPSEKSIPLTLFWDAPQAPTALTGSISSGTVSLSWTAPSAAYPPITGYTISYSSSGPPTTVNTSSAAASYTLHGLTDGTTYAITVSAINEQGPSPASNTFSATPGSVPDAPQNLTAQAGNASILLTWSPSASHGTPVTGYSVTCPPDTRDLPVSGTSGSPISTTLNGLTNGTSYTCSVKAHSQAGDSAVATAMPQTPQLPTCYFDDPNSKFDECIFAD